MMHKEKNKTKKTHQISIKVYANKQRKKIHNLLHA